MVCFILIVEITNVLSWIADKHTTSKNLCFFGVLQSVSSELFFDP